MCIVDLRAGKLRRDAINRFDRMMRDAVVVAFEGEDEVGFRADYGDAGRGFLQRQSAVVLEQDNRLFGGFFGDRAVGRGVVGAEGQIVEWICTLRVEESEFEAEGVEAFGGLGDQIFGN